MTQNYHITWDGVPSRDHEALVRETVARLAQITDQPDYPRGCVYLRVPLQCSDPQGPGIDCHWDMEKSALVCVMDLEDGPLPPELADLPGLMEAPQNWAALLFGVRRQSM